MPSRLEPLRIEIPERERDVSALHRRAADEHALLVFAHGAGAGMEHAFMTSASDALAERGISTLRYQFPYMDDGRRAPSPRPHLLATVRAAVARAVELAGGAARAGGVPVFAGGKSMGGRMTSLAASQAPGLPAVRGIVFFGFPLHPAGRPGKPGKPGKPGRPGDERAAHLADVPQPMLFLQGTRDKLAELSLLEPVCSKLGERATLHIIEGGDHSFHVLKRSGRTDDEVRVELADAVACFVEQTGRARSGAA